MSGFPWEELLVICHPCKDQRHDECVAVAKGKTWCDCGHGGVKKKPEPAK